MDDGRGVEQLTAHGDREAEDEDGGRIGGLAGESLQLPPLAVEEAAPLHEILGRIAADHLLGEGADRHVGVGHFPCDGREARDIGPHGATVGFRLATATFARRIEV